MEVDVELAGAEELREILFAQRRELDVLRRDADDAALLLQALDALLDVDGRTDPFASVFALLEPMFGFSQTLVLAETGPPGSPLRCIVARPSDLVGGEWPASRLFEKVLSGRATATLTSHTLDASPAAGRPALYLPLGFRERRGLMVMLRARGAAGFDRRDLALARKLSLVASHAFAARVANRSERERQRLHDLTEELKTAQEMLAHRANHDVLTGLPNRRFFEEHMAHVLAAPDGRRLALAFVDLDGFKQVNDVNGHSVGDGLLVAVAERVRGQIRGTDVLARISGDEFVLLLDPVEDGIALDRVLGRILGALKQPYSIEGVSLALSASIGVALYPDHGDDYETLRRNADVAMYSAKDSTRGSAVYFDAEIGRAAAGRAERERILRDAVSRRSFRSVLQPKVNLRTMQVNGFEVLVRRVDSDGTLRSPAEFIDLATELGLLDAITDVVLEQTLALLPALDAAFGDDTTISVNVSARQATDPRTMRELLAQLASSGCPERFIVELTEDALLRTDVFQREIVPLFHEFGVRVSIDDFGTGYASMAMLLDITAHELKIDRAFIAGVHARRRNQVILQGLAAASRELGVSVVAEGVETVEEFRYLRESTTIETAQGYLFARPLEPAVLIKARDAIDAKLRALSESLHQPVEAVG